MQLTDRPAPIMLFKLPIMLLSNTPKFALLCPIYAPLCSLDSLSESEDTISPFSAPNFTALASQL